MVGFVPEGTLRLGKAPAALSFTGFSDKLSQRIQGLAQGSRLSRDRRGQLWVGVVDWTVFATGL